MVILFVSFIDCQVILDRAQLAAWMPSYSTATPIDLSYRNRQVEVLDHGSQDQYKN